jgi:putative tricarboxylic transport membrane protein
MHSGAKGMKVDRVLGVGAVVLAIPVGVASWGFGVGSPNSPGAGFWPLVIAAVMFGLGLALFWRPTLNAITVTRGESRRGKFGLSLATLAFYVVALEPLGYLLTTALLLLVQFRWVEGRSRRLSLGIAVAAALVSLVIFRVLLKVSLPAGVIPLPVGW